MLNVAQRWLLKIILNKPNYYPAERIYKESEICNIRKLFTLKSYCLIYRHISCQILTFMVKRQLLYNINTICYII